MLILNPLEPWPAELALGAAAEAQVSVIARVVDYGGLFHDDIQSDHVFRAGDHRSFRPAGWVAAGLERIQETKARLLTGLMMDALAPANFLPA